MIPKKGSKKIIVDGHTYRYTGFLNGHAGDKSTGERDYLTICSNSEKGQTLRVPFTWKLVAQSYEAIGKCLGRFGTFPPFIVRQAILIGLKSGWTPRSGGGIYELTEVENQIDFSLLN